MSNTSILTDIAYRDLHAINAKSKLRNTGTFTKPSTELDILCQAIAKDLDNSDLNWYFEIFYSTRPTGIHNDANISTIMNSKCMKVLLIPLDWSTNTSPATIIFNESYHTKVFEGKQPNTLILADTLESILSPFGKDMIIDDVFYQERLSHSPRYALNGLSIKEELVWEYEKPVIFDSHLIHTAAKFNPGEWKFSLNGLGYKSI